MQVLESSYKIRANAKTDIAGFITFISSTAICLAKVLQSELIPMCIRSITAGINTSIPYVSNP